MKRPTRILAQTLLAIFALYLPALAEPIPAKLERQPSGAWVLTRAGKPYFIKGAGGETHLDELARAGGNSLRTWGADHLGTILDEAQKRHLTVCAGIWLGQPRQGFDYHDPNQVAAQYEMVRATILKYQDHPALLLWALGNEMEGDGNDAAVWSAVNNLASLAHRLDPHHPTMTVIAEIGADGSKLKNLNRLCPDIDIVGVNSYGGAASLADRYREAGGSKPFILTEFGPPGQWEISKTPWGAAPELTSTQKAAVYRNIYLKTVQNQNLCLGSYVFLWGHKQEATATWFGLFLPDGRKTAAVDVMTELWSGQPPANLCPSIEPIRLEGPAQLDPGASVQASVSVTDPEGQPVKIQWVLQREGLYGAGGDAEAVPPTFPDAVKPTDDRHVVVTMPPDGGPYRLFAYADDGSKAAATANVPLLVKGPMKPPESPTVKLPLTVYDENSSKPTYTPSGWMGDTKSLKVDPNCADHPHSGQTCLKVDFSAPSGWAGVVWQSPANDWGDLPGGYNLSGAKTLSFWARGEKGGEVVSFELGLFGRDKKFYDTAHAKLASVKLTDTWTRHEINLSEKDLSRIKSGFCFVVADEGRPITFYLDDIRYEP